MLEFAHMQEKLCIYMCYNTGICTCTCSKILDRVYTGEADLVLHHLKKLDTAGVSLKLTAVITPYNLQVCNNLCQTVV